MINRIEGKGKREEGKDRKSWKRNAAKVRIGMPQILETSVRLSRA